LPVEKVPIGHITNGIHLLGWMKGTVRRFWRRNLTGDSDLYLSDAGGGGEATRFWRAKPEQGWDSVLNSPAFWAKMADPEFVSDEELWALRYRL
jgi:hypothetical protein